MAALLSGNEREGLRERAIAAWERARALDEAAAMLTLDTVSLRSQAADLRTARFRTDQAGVVRVDQMLDGRLLSPPLRGDGVGLALASRITRIGTFHEGLHRRLPVVWTARDPASALGITIMNQPDVALVDDELPMLGGLDAVLLLRGYAPETRFVLFTMDDETMNQAGREGVIVNSADASLDEVVETVDGVLAA